MNQYNPYQAPTASPDQFGTGGHVHNPQVGVSELTVEHLRQTKPWVTFIGVMYIIGAALMGLGGLFFMGTMPGDFAWLGILYVVMAAVMVIPSLHLLRYGSQIGNLISGGGVHALEEALSHQKSFWKFVGILAAIMLGLYALAFAIGMAGAIF